MNTILFIYLLVACNLCTQFNILHSQNEFFFYPTKCLSFLYFTSQSIIFIKIYIFIATTTATALNVYPYICFNSLFLFSYTTVNWRVFFYFILFNTLTILEITVGIIALLKLKFLKEKFLLSIQNAAVSSKKQFAYSINSRVHYCGLYRSNRKRNTEFLDFL